MKKLFRIIPIVLLSTSAMAQSIGIGTSTPSASAALEISSNTKGLLIPRMTSAQRLAIPAPANGLMVYDLSTSSTWYYNGSAWASLGGTASLSIPVYHSVNVTDTAFHIKNSGSVAIAGEGAGHTGVAGISSSSNGVEGSSVSGNGIYGNSFSGHGVYAYSFNGNGVMANSTNGSAVYGFSNNANATIYGSNSNGLGVGVQGNGSLNHGVLGTTAGTGKAGVKGEATGSGGVGVLGTTTSDLGYGVQGTNSTGVAIYGSSNTGTGVRAVSNSGLALDVNGRLKIAGGNTNPSYGAVLTSDASGNATWTNTRIAFSASGLNLNFQLLAPNVNVRYHFGNEQYDLGNDFNLFTGTNPFTTSSSFTVPVSGIYHFDAFATVAASAGNEIFTSGYITLTVRRGAGTFNGASSTMAISTDSYGSLLTGSLSRDIRLLAGDIIYIELYQTNDENATSYLGGAYLNGHLVLAD